VDEDLICFYYINKFLLYIAAGRRHFPA